MELKIRDSRPSSLTLVTGGLCADVVRAVSISLIPPSDPSGDQSMRSAKCAEIPSPGGMANSSRNEISRGSCDWKPRIIRSAASLAGVYKILRSAATNLDGRVVYEQRLV